jgi:hypothetical protein
MTIHDNRNPNRSRDVPRDNSATSWTVGIALVAVALLITVFIFGTADQSGTTTATNAGPPATGPASTANNPLAGTGTTGSANSPSPTPAPSPSPNR